MTEQLRTVTESDGKWRKVTESDGKWRKVTESGGTVRHILYSTRKNVKWRKVTEQLRTVTESDGKWRKVTESDGNDGNYGKWTESVPWKVTESDAKWQKVMDSDRKWRKVDGKWRKVLAFRSECTCRDPKNNNQTTTTMATKIKAALKDPNQSNANSKRGRQTSRNIVAMEPIWATPDSSMQSWS